MEGLPPVQNRTPPFASGQLLRVANPEKVFPDLTQSSNALKLNSSTNSVFFSLEGVLPLQVRVFYHDKCFDGACSASPRITWWFDHHLSAFLTPADHQHFLDYQKSARANPYEGKPSEGLKAQAWDRGAEAASRYNRFLSGIEKPKASAR